MPRSRLTNCVTRTNVENGFGNVMSCEAAYLEM
jgi:hypothetical protein